MSSFLNIVHVSILESQLAANMCCRSCTKYKKSEGKQSTYTKGKKKEEKHDMQVRRICKATIPEQLPGTHNGNTVYIILKGLGLESQQKISSIKLLCCCHSNHYISRTLDLCRLLLGGYCSTQASFARASASYHHYTCFSRT